MKKEDKPIVGERGSLFKNLGLVDKTLSSDFDKLLTSSKERGGGADSRERRGDID